MQEKTKIYNNNYTQKELSINDIEITCEVYDDIPHIKEELEKHNFHYVEEFTLDDIYMHNPETGEFTQNKGKITDTLIIRYVNENDKKIICKKRNYDSKGRQKGTEKTMLKIQNMKEAEKLLNMLGYNRFLRMIDKNYMYEHENYIAYIQNVEGLGTFLEIEAKSKENIEAEIQKLIELIKTFKLKIGINFDVRKAELLYKKEKAQK